MTTSLFMGDACKINHLTTARTSASALASSSYTILLKKNKIPKTRCLIF